MNLKTFNLIMSEFEDDEQWLYDIWFDWDLYYDL